MKKITVKLDRPTAEAIERLAKDAGVSRAAVVNVLLALAMARVRQNAEGLKRLDQYEQAEAVRKARKKK